LVSTPYIISSTGISKRAYRRDVRQIRVMI
jgi:hypothetical protein